MFKMCVRCNEREACCGFGEELCGDCYADAQEKDREEIRLIDINSRDDWI